jgi:hypothetical protein
MPNWCQNVVTFSHTDPTKINDILKAAEFAAKNDGDNFLNVFVPRPVTESENWYDWNTSNWGTKWDVNPRVTEDAGHSITLSFDSAWAPPVEFYRAMVDEHGYEVMAFYNEEGMAFAGVFDNGHDDYYEYAELDSDEIAEQLPFDLDEMFNISANKAEWESEQEMDDGQPDEAQEWHDFDPDC